MITQQCSSAEAAAESAVALATTSSKTCTAIRDEVWGCFCIMSRLDEFVAIIRSNIATHRRVALIKMVLNLFITVVSTRVKTLCYDRLDSGYGQDGGVVNVPRADYGHQGAVH